MLLRSFKNPKIQVRGFREAAWRDCAIHANYTLCGPPVQSGWAGRPQPATRTTPRRRTSQQPARLPAQRSRPYLPFGSRVKRRRGQNHQGQNRRCPKRSAARALRTCALGISGTEAQPRLRRQERINALPRPPTSRHDQQGQGRQGFAERQNPYGRQLRPTIESVTGRRASSIWVEDAREPGLRMVRTTNGPITGAVFVARGQDMGREINLEAANRLNLRDAVALSHSYFLHVEGCVRATPGPGRRYGRDARQRG